MARDRISGKPASGGEPAGGRSRPSGSGRPPGPRANNEGTRAKNEGQRTNNDGAPGEHLVAELRWVHGVLRRDLKTISALADQVTAGGSAKTVGKAVRSLQTNSPLWQLRVNCLRYCAFVHSHHGGEDVRLFPALRRSSPDMGPVVDRLESDHRVVSDLLDQVESLARLLASEDSRQTRERLVDALRSMGTTLLAHLDFEEKSITPTLRKWHRWPM